jgi:hypothetical protein
VKFINASFWSGRTYYREIEEPKRFFCAEEEDNGSFSVYDTDRDGGEPIGITKEKLRIKLP